MTESPSYFSLFTQLEQLDDPFSDDVPHACHSQADHEHIEPAPENAAPGKEAAGAAHGEVRQH